MVVEDFVTHTIASSMSMLMMSMRVFYVPHIPWRRWRWAYLDAEVDAVSC